MTTQNIEYQQNKWTFEMNIIVAGVNTGILDGGNMYGSRHTYNKISKIIQYVSKRSSGVWADFKHSFSGL